MTPHPDMTVLGPKTWEALHQWASRFREGVGDSCECGKFAVKAASALHDLVNAKLGKPLYDPVNFRAFQEMVGDLKAPAELSLAQLLQESDVLMGRSTAPPREQLGLDLFPVAPPVILPTPDLPSVEERIRELEAELQRLRGLLPGAGLPPSVSKYQPYPFQREGIAWLKDKSVALLADEMGLGKTVQAIYWAADGRLPALVVVPAAVAYNWQSELREKWRPGDSVTLLFTGESEVLPRELADWTITTYSQAPKFLPQLQRANFKSIIIDEAQYIKTLDAQRTKTVLDLVAPEKATPGQTPIPNRLAVTGTPIMNRPPEIFPVLVFLGKEPRNGYRRFVDQYAERREAAGREYFVGYKNLEGLNRRLQPFMLRRLKADVLTQLPPKVQRPIWVGLTNADEYREAERNFLEWYRLNVGDEAADKIAYSTQMQILVQLGQLRHIAARGKIGPVTDFLAPCQETGHKVLVFSNFVDVVEEMQEAQGGLLYTGATPKDERDEMVKQFQTDPATCFFFGTIGAAGVGITLTAADRAVFVDLPWTPAAKVQAEDRAHRIGQTKQVEVIPFLAKGTVDERVMELLAEKERIIAQAVDGLSADQALQSSITAGLIRSYREVAYGRQKVLVVPQYVGDDDTETLEGWRQGRVFRKGGKAVTYDGSSLESTIAAAFKLSDSLPLYVVPALPSCGNWLLVDWRPGRLFHERLEESSCGWRYYGIEQGGLVYEFWVKRSQVRGEYRVELKTRLDLIPRKRETKAAPQPTLFQGRDPWGSRCRDSKTGEWVDTEFCGPVPQDGLPARPSAPALTVAVSADGVRRYEFEHRLVEASALIPSHDPFTFQVNPAFAQKLQPRMRDRAAAELQVLRIASTLSPDALLTDFHTLDRGAPIVGPDMLVESGNGRVMGIIRAIQDYPDNFVLYRGELEKRAGAVGMDAFKAHGMKAPVLVRVRKTALSDQERVAFVLEANVPSGISRSAIEQARTDSEKITLAMLDTLEVAEGESIFDALRAVRNAPFVRAFLGSLPENERAAALDAQGRINQDGIRRASQAIFVSAFGAGEPGLRLGEMAFESADQDVRNIFNGISRALGPLAKAESLVRSKARDVSLSIGDDLAQTVRVFAKIKNDPSLTVAKYLDQSQMFERELTPFQEVMLRTLDEHRRSAKRLGEIFRAYAGLVDTLPPPEQEGLFGPVEPPTKEMVWDQALRRAEQPQEERREAVLVQEGKEPWQMTGAEIQTMFPVVEDVKFGPRFVMQPYSGPLQDFQDEVSRIGTATKPTGRVGRGATAVKGVFSKAQLDDIRDKAHRALVARALSQGKSIPPEVLADYPDLLLVQEGTLWPTEVKGQYAQRIRWCNTPKDAIDRILNWRPLRSLLYQGIAYQVAVEVCVAGFGGDQYQVSIGYRAEGAWRKGYLTEGQVKALRKTAAQMGATLAREVRTRDLGLLVWQVTLPGPEAENLVLKPQFPEEKPQEERIDPRLQPALFQGQPSGPGGIWPDPTYEPFEEEEEEEDGPTIRHRVKTVPRKPASGGGVMPQDRRPPKPWWESCISEVEGDDPAAICGRIWTRIRPSVKARIRREGEAFHAQQEPDAPVTSSFIDFIVASVRQGTRGFAVVARNEPLWVIDDREEKCKAMGGTWKDGKCVTMPITGVINPQFVEGDVARMDLGTNLQELADILSHPERMGEVDGNTQRIVRKAP